tara:strand:+ start:370 stop:954 length:585 start_codon:yes stop_codon:yes gene_type:complete
MIILKEYKELFFLYIKIMSLTIYEKKQLVLKISKLTETEHLEIYKIISNETSSFTENKNGIFINLNLLNDSTINKIVNYVNMCEENELSNEQEEDIPDNNSIIIDEIDLEDEIEQEPEIDNYTTSEKIVLQKESLKEKEKEKEIDKEKDKNIELETDKKLRYTGIRARVIKNCKDNKQYDNLSVDDELDELDEC